MAIHNDHNVYILGAGFSYDAGMPLIGDFLLRMRDSHDWLEKQGMKSEAEAVSKVLDFRLKAASAAYWVTMDLENIEELFSLASAKGGDMDRHIRLAIAATLKFAASKQFPTRHSFGVNGPSKLFEWKDINSVAAGCPSWTKPQFDRSKPGPNPGYVGPFSVDSYAFDVARLLGMFQNGQPKGENTFITFNYDTILEQSLEALNVEYYYGFRPGTAFAVEGAKGVNILGGIPLLKLHGSTNWSRVNGEGVLNVRRPSQKALQEPLTPELLPPTWKKVIQTQLGDVWEEAIQRLSTATRVIIIGFSMPPTDMHFKYLLAAGFQTNISLRNIIFVKPNAENDLKDRVKKLLRGSDIDSGRIEFESATFRTFVRNYGGHVPKFNKLDRPFEEKVSFQNYGDSLAVD
jgi:hypothetical protein